MSYKEWKIKEGSNGWCRVYKNNVFQSETIDIEEARRYIWMQLKGTPDEIDYLSKDMMND